MIKDKNWIRPKSNDWSLYVICEENKEMWEETSGGVWGDKSLSKPLFISLPNLSLSLSSSLEVFWSLYQVKLELNLSLLKAVPQTAPDNPHLRDVHCPSLGFVYLLIKATLTLFWLYIHYEQGGSMVPLRYTLPLPSTTVFMDVPLVAVRYLNGKWPRTMFTP